MTQPVQEPTQGRTDQRQEFGVRQLQRRPSPSPGGAWAKLFRSTSFAVAGSSSAPFEWRSFKCSENTDSVFSTSDDGTTVTNAQDDPYLLLQAAGVYTIQIEGQWAAATTDGAILISSFGANNLETGWSRHPDSDWSAVVAAFGTDGTMRDEVVVAVATVPGCVFVTAYNDDGVSRNVSVALMASYVPTSASEFNIY